MRAAGGGALGGCRWVGTASFCSMPQRLPLFFGDVLQEVANLACSQFRCMPPVLEKTSEPIILDGMKVCVISCNDSGCLVFRSTLSFMRVQDQFFRLKLPHPHPVHTQLHYFIVSI